MLRFGVLLVCAAALQAQTEGAWASRAPVPLALAEASAATLGDEVYVVCGIVGIGQYSNRLFAYNPSADSWRERAPLPITGGVERCNVAAWDGKLYLAGAIRVGRGFLSAQTFVYDPAADAWTQKERMGAVHAAAGVAALDGKIYVAGGEGEQRAATVFEAFDVATERWQALSDLPQPRTRLTAQAVNGKFYAVGGRLPGAAPQREVFEYDPAAGSWRTRAPMPTARSDAASAVLGGKILVFGGEGAGGEVLAEVEEFDPAANTWRSLSPMPNPRHGLAGAAFGAEAHLLVGASASNISATHDVFFLRSSPGFTSSGVVSAASFQPGLAPGSIASIFAANLSSGGGVARALPLPRSLGGFEVRIDGEPAPLYFASAAQANVLIPLTASGVIRIVASDSGLESAPVDIELSTVAPAVFTLEQTGRGQAAALISGAGMVAGPGGRPVRPGEALEIYLAGLGAVVNPPQAGAAGPVSPLARTLKLPRITLGGASAEVLFSGLAPGLAGVYQVNVLVSPSTPSGQQVELLVEMDGVPSQPGVFVAVE